MKAAKETSLEPHKESNAHLFYGAKTRDWDGWGTGNDGWTINKDATLIKDAWSTGVYETKFTIVLDEAPGLQMGDTPNLAVAWAIEWQGEEKSRGVKASGGAG